jgi:dTDP-4-dehydrorhamnose reductase
MKILILGRGFIGNQLHSSLCNIGLSAKVISKSELDYTRVNPLYWYLKDFEYDVVINASGYTGVPNIDAAEDDKQACWKYNVEVPTAIATAVNRLTTRDVSYIHISSGCIYNGYDRQFTEDDTPNFGLFNPESSFYSKTKHAAETCLKEMNAILLRIRMPFCGEVTDRNYFAKLLKYDNLISMENSVTCIDDLCDVVALLCNKHRFSGSYKYRGEIYNVVNEGSLNAKQVVDCLAKYNLTNPNHKFIDLSELDTKARRSNCILSIEKMRTLFQMPNALESLEKSVKRYSESLEDELT